MWAVMCVCRHVCHTQARSCLSPGWALNRFFAWVFGTAAVLAQGGGGAGFIRPLVNMRTALYFRWSCCWMGVCVACTTKKC